MKNLIVLLGAVFITSCATVGAVIEGGKDLTTSDIDSTVKTAGNITTSALEDAGSVVDTVSDSVSNVIETVVENVDEQTDEIQNTTDSEDVK